MNIYSFINSKDIREHLQSINYRFNSIETTWLIYQCHRLSYEEKKTLWQELIQTMPDCILPQRNYETETENLHESIGEDVLLRLYRERLLKIAIADDIEIASWEEDGRYEGLI